ncbi:T9SS type A sorting domain-containing protein [Adhaeribacter swui]|uniref:T9SS type A sorting domain-containing protein n=1 Tax=Adhaeribacter swui TaxID=2086471 RepID=A0A7G7G4P7_9BACT|nr:T9SS type A sorting domain-containing protein [Adhaeribacter swui]QNF32131.1 T9SS type A sorting domain-containing protein [Adhaeribacter swui]
MKKHLSRFYALAARGHFFKNWHYSGLLLLAIILFPQRSWAQKVLWDKTIGSKQSESLASLQPTRDGGYIAGGTFYPISSGGKNQDSRGKGGSDYWVVKLKADGTVAWDKLFGGKDGEGLAFAQQTQDGGYILGGTSDSGISGDKTGERRDTSNYFAYKGDYWIVKLNADGEKEWDKTIGGLFIDQLASIKQTQDGGYILGGTSVSGVGGDKTQPAKRLGGDDYWIVKLNADGEKEWDKTIGGQDQDRLDLVQQTRDGNYLVSGYSSSDKGFDKSAPNKGGTDLWLVMLDGKGNKIWDKTYGGNSDEGGLFGKSVLLPTQDGGYLLGSTSTSNVSGDKSQPSRGWADYWVVKLTANGTKVWDTTVGGHETDDLTAIQQNPDGSYILGGVSESNISSEKSEASKGSYDYWVVKLNANGKFVADKTIGSKASDFLYALTNTPDNNFILGGTSSGDKSGDKTQNSKGESDLWLVKLQNHFLLNQTLVFDPVLNQEVGSPPVALQAKASSGLPIRYQVIAGPATIAGNKLTVTGPGNIKLKAIQSGNEQYKAVEAFQNLVATLTGKQMQMAFGSTKADTLTAMLATPDGGYLLAGTSGTNNSASGDKSQGGEGSTDYWVVKMAADGTKLWDKTYGGTAAEKLTALVATPDGGYLLGGSSNSPVSGNKTQPGKGQADYWLVKINADGNYIWDKSLGGKQDDKLTTILVTPGGYLLGGSSASEPSGDKSAANKGYADYWVVKINQEGSKIWDRTYGGNNQDDLAALLALPEGGYLVGGTSASEVSGDKTQATRGFADYWVLRINEQGTKIWDNTYGGIIGYGTEDIGNFETGFSILSSLVATPDGGYLLGGSSSAFAGAEKTDDSPVGFDPITDYWVVKIDKSGKKLWDESYGALSKSYGSFDQTGNAQLNKIIPLPEGGYLLAGTSNGDRGRDKTDDNRSDIPVGGSEYSDEFGDRIPNTVWNDYWIVKIDEKGKKLEDRTLGGQRNDVLADVLLTHQGNLLLGGTSFSGVGADKSSPLRGAADYWLVQVSFQKPTSANWDMSYETQNNEELFDVIKTRDGGYLSGGLSGYRRANNTGGGYYIVKSDKNGNLLWSKSYYGTSGDYLSRVIQTHDGGYLLAGTSYSGRGNDKSQYSRGESDYWILKVDAAGNKQWDKRFGGTGADDLRKVIQLTTGEYVLAGHSNSPAGGDKSQGTQGGSDLWLIKISGTGIKIWDKRYGGTQDETLGSFTSTNDGGFLLGGSSVSGLSGDKTEKNQGKSDYWVVKVDRNGKLLWDKTFGGSGEDQAYSVGRSNQNNLFIAGHSDSPISGSKSQKSQGGSDYWLIKLDGSGNKLWDKTFGGSQNDDLRASTYTLDGGYLLGGTSTSAAGGDKTQPSQGGRDYWAVKLDAAGNKQWDQRFGGDQDEDLRTVFQTPDGGYMLGGSSKSDISGNRSQPNLGLSIRNGNTSDFWLVKLAPVNTATSLITPAINPLTELTTTEELATLTGFPNPFQDKVTITFTLPETQTATLRILDSQGSEIKTLFRQKAQANQTYQLEWQAGKQEAGLYFVQLQTPAGQTTKKILLQK